MIETRGFAAGEEDAFLTLYRECLAYYRIAPATEAQEARVTDILASGRHMSCLLAFAENEPAGFATWALTLPAGSGVALYMKEIFVSDRARGQGVGRALLAELLRIAEAEGCTRLDWQTDGDNPASQAFYTSIKAPVKDKISYRVTADDFARFRRSLL